jgi:hypothetical protein
MTNTTQPECPCKSGDVNYASESNPIYPNEAYCPWCGHSYGVPKATVEIIVYPAVPWRDEPEMTEERRWPCPSPHIEGYEYDHDESAHVD